EIVVQGGLQSSEIVFWKIVRPDLRGKHQAKPIKQLVISGAQYDRTLLPCKNSTERFYQPSGQVLPWFEDVLFQIQIDDIKREPLKELLQLLSVTLLPSNLCSVEFLLRAR